MPELRKHGQRIALLALVLAAVALWGASRLTWVQVRTVDDLRGVRVSTLTGETWTAELAPLALVALAAVAASLAVRGLALRVLALVLVLVGVAAAVPGAQLLIVGASTERAAGLATPPALAEHASTTSAVGGPALALLGALFTLVAAGFLLRAPRTAAGLPSRYQSPAALKDEAAAKLKSTVDENVSERLLWDALDAGRDPTAESGAEGDSYPPGDADHHPDKVGEVQAGETTRGARGNDERA